MDAQRQLVSPAVVAKAVGVKPETVLAWFRRGWIPGYRAGRRPVLFDVAEVQSAMAARAATGQRDGEHSAERKKGGTR
jgi:hypothetical protein